MVPAPRAAGRGGDAPLPGGSAAPQPGGFPCGWAGGSPAPAGAWKRPFVFRISDRSSADLTSYFTDGLETQIKALIPLPRGAGPQPLPKPGSVTPSPGQAAVTTSGPASGHPQQPPLPTPHPPTQDLARRCDFPLCHAAGGAAAASQPAADGRGGGNGDGDTRPRAVFGFDLFSVFFSQAPAGIPRVCGPGRAHVGAGPRVLSLRRGEHPSVPVSPGPPAALPLSSDIPR